MSHYNYFYNFHNKPLGQGLFSQAPTKESITPPPPGNPLLDNDGSNLLNNDGTTLEDN
jgi:hypothetical protein